MCNFFKRYMELKILFSANCQLMLYICAKFRSCMVFKLYSGHNFHTFITKEHKSVEYVYGITVLSAHCLMKLYIHVKFPENILNGFKVK